MTSSAAVASAMVGNIREAIAQKNRFSMGAAWRQK